MTQPDFTQHNEDVRAVWQAYRSGKPVRVPVIVDADTRYFVLHDGLNPGERMSFEDYSEDAITMMDFQLRAAEYRVMNLNSRCDYEAGLPERFSVTVDMQRYFDAGFFGAEVEYRAGQIPDTIPPLTGDRKNWLFDRGQPDPLTGGVFAEAHQLHEVMAERLASGLTFRDREVVFEPFGLDTDGPLTVATNLRGTELYADFYNDPDYVHALLDFIVEGTIARIKAHRRFFDLPEISETWGYADDSVQLISTPMLREFIIPAHHKLIRGLTDADRIRIHLCGNATRHFKTLRDELGCYSFDTGFPVDFAWLRGELGPEVEIKGGPRVTLLRDGTPDQVEAEVRRILASGITEGGRFILREANDLAPGTPLANLDAMYAAGRRYGVY
jgi:hypothetical protein